VQKDFGEAIKWFRLAAEQGHARAQFNLGYMYAVGEGVEQSDDEARAWFELAANQGLDNAQNKLGRYYDSVKDYDEAFSWYERAAKQGHASAQACLGYAYSNGRGVPQDLTEALEWYRLAAEQGHAEAQFNLANFYFLGKGIPRNDPEAMKWFHLAAEQDYPLAQLNLGSMYYEGRCAPENLDLARLWWSLSAAHGDALAQKSLSLTEPVNTEFDALVGKAIGGDVESQRNLAIHLHYADGAPHEKSAAMIFLRRAAEGGDPWAQTTLAIELRNTKKPDKEVESVRFLSLAAAQRDARARLTLGLHQSLGIGTPVDIESAAVNMIMASLAGFEGARDLAAKIIAALDETSRAKVIERVEWADLTLILGPLVEGHHDRVRESQENDDGSDNALWLQFERESADIMFGDKKRDGDSILTSVFGEKVAIRAFSVNRIDTRRKRVAATTISLRDIVLANGFPVYWKPDDEALRALGSLFGLMEGRAWIEWLYAQH
jgi:TPR repeat protein